MLTACASTTPPSGTNGRTVEIAVMPAAPAELLTPPARPAQLKAGTTAAILHHAVEIGTYIGELENQNAAWRAWATGKEVIYEP